MENGFYKPGDKVIFDTMDIEFGDWDPIPIRDIYDKHLKSAKVLFLSCSTGEPGEKDYEYYDIEFEDGKIFEAISGYHLTPLSNM